MHSKSRDSAVGIVIGYGAGRQRFRSSSPGGGKNFHFSISQSHIAADSQSGGLSWCRAPSGTYDQKFVYLIWLGKFRVLSMWAPSLTRGRVCRLSVICVRSLSVCTVYLQNLLYRIKWSALYTIFTRPLSVQAQYSRLCPTTSSFRYNGSLRHLNGRKHFFMSSRPAVGPTNPPIQWVPGSLSPGVKRPGDETDNSTSTNAAVKKTWFYTSTPPYAFMA
jgi:hypothetical protein